MARSRETGPGRDAWRHAIRCWREALGAHRLDRNTERYNRDTGSRTGTIPVALRPAKIAHVQAILEIANRFCVPVYPVSTGHNWGYGTSVPVRSPSAIMDLGGMRRILSFDTALGAVTLEPGVTQQGLRRYLDREALPFLVPVTGAGPDCSVLANAFERGFGITPVVDHFAAVLSLRAVLPDGSLYESPFRSFPGAGTAAAYKWGTGPHLDALFSQSGLGIVVDATIALRPKSDCRAALLFTLSSGDRLEAASSRVGDLLEAAGGHVAAVNLMSRGRLLAMARGAGRLRGSQTEAESPDPPGGAWFGLGSIYCPRTALRTTRRLIRRHLGGCASNLRILTPGRAAMLARLGELGGRLGLSRSSASTRQIRAVFDILDGRPTRFALPLAYAGSGAAADRTDLDPARDGCGLSWYSPIVPSRPGNVTRFVQLVAACCSSFGFAAPITLTTLSPRTFAATVPILFDREDPAAEQRARDCLEALCDRGLAEGFVPYRLGPQLMNRFLPGSGAGPLAARLKELLDPNGILAPGRYARAEP